MLINSMVRHLRWEGNQKDNEMKRRYRQKLPTDDLVVLYPQLRPCGDEGGACIEFKVKLKSTTAVWWDGTPVSVERPRRSFL